MQKIILAMAFLLLSQATFAGGLLNLHRQEDLGNKICMKNHFHRGVGMAAVGMGDSAEIEAYARAYDRAVRKWSWFVGKEYGEKRASWQLSEAQDVSCHQALRVWFCRVKAKPCEAKN